MYIVYEGKGNVVIGAVAWLRYHAFCRYLSTKYGGNYNKDDN